MNMKNASAPQLNVRLQQWHNKTQNYKNFTFNTDIVRLKLKARMSNSLLTISAEAAI